MPRRNPEVDVIIFCVDRVWPVAGGLSARLFALSDFLRGEGLRVGLVTVKHSLADSAAIAGQLDAVWFHGGTAQVLRQQVGRSSLLRRSVGAVRSLRSNLRQTLPEPLKALAIRPLRRLLTGHAHGKPQPASMMARKISPAFDAFARQCAVASWAKVAIAEFAWTAGGLAGLPESVLTIVDTHDIQHLRRQRAQEARHDLPDRNCTREEEVAALSHGQVLLAIQAGEAETLREMLPQKRVIVAEHALGGATWLPAPAGSKDLLYVGNLYPPNVAGANDFLDRVWPALRARVPEARFVVCGKVCDALLGRAESGLKLEGMVNSLDVYYQEAAVVVNLVPYGTGLKIKTVEALAHGKCTVVTPAGAEGLRVRPAHGLTVCALDDMPGVLAGLLEDPAARRREEEAAWAFAQAHLTPAAVYAELSALLKEHLRR